jgi:hypothetical protein
MFIIFFIGENKLIRLKTFSLLLLLPFISSCTSSYQKAKVMSENNRSMDYYNIQIESLKRSEYIILGDVEGFANYENDEIQINQNAYEYDTSSFLVDKYSSLTYKIPLYKEYDEVEQAAIYDALSKIPEADFLVSLRFETKSNLVKKNLENSQQITIKKKTVKVRGKAIKIKTDIELNKR